MKKIVCDRCGTEFRPRPDWAQAPIFEYRIAFVTPSHKSDVDLCRECQRELYKFINDGMDPEAEAYNEIARVIDADERR